MEHAVQDPAISWSTNRGQIGFSRVVGSRDDSALISQEALMLVVVAVVSDVRASINLQNIIWHTDVVDLLVCLVQDRHASIAVAECSEGVPEPK